MKKVRLVLGVMGLALALALSVGGPAYGRAGGGEGFSDSGGGGSSSGSDWSSSSSSDYSSSGGSSSGSGDAIFMILFSRLPWPVKLVLIVIIVVVAAASKRRKKVGGGAATAVFTAPSSSPGYSAPPPPRPTAMPNVGEQLAELKSRDPGFGEQQFRDMASTSFFKIQQAWSARNMSMATAFMSTPLLQRFTTQINEMKQAGRTNKIEKLVVGSIEIVEAAHDGNHDYVTVRIKAAAADYTVDDKTGNMLSGSKDQKPFTEYWTFMRSDSVKTPEKGEQAEVKSCPKCGAPISVNAVGKCDYCGSDVTSGDFNWVLSEIVQESVWKPRTQYTQARPANVSPLAGGRYVLGIVQCPQCGANVQDIAGVTNERCWRCGATVATEK